MCTECTSTWFYPFTYYSTFPIIYIYHLFISEYIYGRETGIFIIYNIYYILYLYFLKRAPTAGSVLLS